MIKTIFKVSTAKFKVSTADVVGSELELDFNPIIKQFNLKGSYLLIHWQAKPKGHREWGIYSSVDDRYRSVTDIKQNTGTWKSLQLDDASAKSIPSAVVFTTESTLNCLNDVAIIGNLTVDDFMLNHHNGV